MADLGHELTEKELQDLEKRIAEEYRQATNEVRAKFERYMQKTEAQRQVQEALFKAGKITEKEYRDWCFRHYMVGARWEEMRDILADDFHRANEIALKMSRNGMADVYALNGNYATYQIEHVAKIDTGFTLYNHDTAEYLLGDQRQLMPGPSTKKAAEIAVNKDLQWNKQKIQSAVLQGILQGEGPYEVAKRLQGVGQMNYNSAVRYARTMTTSAQNAGRYEAYRRADRLGVDLTIEWSATLDQRTRHDHRMMHGQRHKVDEPFITPDGFKILYPADCSGSSDVPQKEIWNCRCTLLSWVKGFEGDTVKSSPKMGEMSFEEWQEAKAMPKDEQDAWLKAGSPNLDEWEKLKKEGKSGFTSRNNNSKIKTRSGSRQSREKYERLSELENASPKVIDRNEVVSGLKPISGKHTRKQDIVAVNPNWDTGLPEWGNNCQRCVTTYEARRRGYDVTALPCYSLNEPIARGTGFTFPYEKGDRHPDKLWHAAGLQFSEARTFTNERCLAQIQSMMDEYGNGSRAIIEGFWNSNGKGHVFIAENVGGKIHFFDPQNKKMDCESYISDMSPVSMGIFRIDDLPFSSYISEVFRNDIE